ncbi:unnamed protein product, partial [Meganyctiphanes norvegica]
MYSKQGKLKVEHIIAWIKFCYPYFKKVKNLPTKVIEELSSNSCYTEKLEGEDRYWVIYTTEHLMILMTNMRSSESVKRGQRIPTQHFAKNNIKFSTSTSDQSQNLQSSLLYQKVSSNVSETNNGIVNPRILYLEADTSSNSGSSVLNTSKLSTSDVPSEQMNFGTTSVLNERITNPIKASPKTNNSSNETSSSMIISEVIPKQTSPDTSTSLKISLTVAEKASSKKNNSLPEDGVLTEDGKITNINHKKDNKDPEAPHKFSIKTKLHDDGKGYQYLYREEGVTNKLIGIKELKEARIPLATSDNWKDAMNLPTGWTQKFGHRKKGSSQGQIYIYYISPQGRKLTSRHGLRNYCLFNNVDGGDLNQFVFTGKRALELIEQYQVALENEKQMCKDNDEYHLNETGKNNNQGIQEEKIWPRPPYTLKCLCMLALKNSSSGVLNLSEICDFIKRHFPYYRTDKNVKGSITSALNMYNKVFKKSIIIGINKMIVWHLNISNIGLEKLQKEIETMRQENINMIMDSMEIPGVLELLENGDLKFESIYTGKKKKKSFQGSSEDHGKYNKQNKSEHYPKHN